jgi:hypothetical protein
MFEITDPDFIRCVIQYNYRTLPAFYGHVSWDIHDMYPVKKTTNNMMNGGVFLKNDLTFKVALFNGKHVEK